MRIETRALKVMVLLVLAFASYVVPAYSQGTAAPKKSGSKVPVVWKQEPTSFIGIPLDQPLTANVKECPQGEPYTELCMSSRYSAQHLVEVCCVRIEPFETVGYVYTSDSTREGKVGLIELNFESARFKQVADILIVRYGRPHKQEVKKVKTKGGAEFDSVEMSWVGAQARIVATSLSSRFFSESAGRLIELGTVMVWTESYAGQKASKADEAARKGAGKL